MNKQIFHTLADADQQNLLLKNGKVIIDYYEGSNHIEIYSLEGLLIKVSCAVLNRTIEIMNDFKLYPASSLQAIE